MRTRRTLRRLPLAAATVAALSLAAPSSLAGGDLHLNELYVSHDGQDDQEFIELVGTPGRSLDDCFLVVVEGDQSSSTGTGIVDDVIDLGGLVLPADGYFVAGVDAVPGRDLLLGTQNAFENGSATYYLIQTTDPSALLALVGQDVDPDGDGVTQLVGLPGAGVLDLVGLVDDDAGDVVFDGALVLGPDGADVPPGIYRALDHPGRWCPEFLDYDDLATSHQARTPGAATVSCLSGDLGQRFCAATPNSSGAAASLTATGSALVADDTLGFSVSGLPPGAHARLFAGDQTIQVPLGDGTRCAGGQVLFLHPLWTASSTGVAGRDLSLSAGPASAAFLAGSTWNFQLWYRDVSGGPAGSNTSDALSIAFR